MAAAKNKVATATNVRGEKISNEEAVESTQTALAKGRSLPGGVRISYRADAPGEITTLHDAPVSETEGQLVDAQTEGAK